jgi:hypothetical protein
MYAAIGFDDPLDFPELCNITDACPINTSTINLQKPSVSDIHQSFLLGFILSMYFARVNSVPDFKFYATGLVRFLYYSFKSGKT